jgi:hypothetical protein
MNTVEYNKVYFCCYCKKRADTNGYIQLNIYGGFKCVYCNNSYLISNLLVYNEPSLFVDFSSNRLFYS